MKCFQIDAFTGQPFSGNPAAVCILDREMSERWMQQVAAEMNLSETAFVRNLGDHYSLRWFTPTVEVDLCGHATLAAAHALWTAKLATSALRFHTRSGWLTCTRSGDRIELDFPALPSTPWPPDPGLLDALGVAATYVGATRFDRLVVLDRADIVRHLKPDFARLRSLGVRGVIVTARSDELQFDFISRFFAPGAGIDEDPVTGSAHCALAVYWGKILNRTEMTGYQASARGGVVTVKVAGDRVMLGGQAVTVWEGTLLATDDQ